ncbi:MAG: TrkH family potassium uptake protein [Anaerovoracaceae bacterium]
MSVNFNGVIRIMGILFIIMGLAFLPSLLVAIIYGEWLSLRCFLWTIIPCFIIGTLLVIKFHPSLIKPKVRDGFLIVSMSWLAASIIGAVPLVLSGSIPNPFDAFFEMCSGFSTTGSTILTDIESLPKSMLFWRSFTHWLGGMGIIVFLMALMPALGIGGQLIASAETPGPTLDKLTPRFSDTAKNLYLLYLLFTVVETILLMFGGMTLYDALVQTFGTVGTGGFSNYGDSIAHFNSPYIEWVIIVFMLMCGVNFNIYFIAIKQSIKRALKDSELRLYLSIVVATSALIAINIYASNMYGTFSESVRAATFQISSIVTTTGYATADYDLWPTFSRMLIMLVMLTGACSSSTGGGVKMIRVLVALKLVRRGVSLKIHPRRIVSVNVNGKPLPSDTTTNIANFIFMYIFVIFVGSFIISFNGFDMLTSISSVITCVGNIGPGFNLVGPVMNFSIFSNFSKLVLSFLMIAGRLELFTFFMLFSRHYWDSNRA